MSFNLESFINNPSVDQLELNLRKEDWRQLAQAYHIDAPSRLRKDELKRVVINHFVESFVLDADAFRLCPQQSVRDEGDQEVSDSDYNLQAEARALPQSPFNKSVVSLEVEKIKLGRERMNQERELEIMRLREKRELELLRIKRKTERTGRASKRT